LQQVRLAKSLPKNWAVRALRRSGRPVFLAIANLYMQITGAVLRL
jgi:hypothetical protein